MFYRSHNRVTLDCGDNLVTKQSHKDECDIHRILKQYQRTGVITHVQRAEAQFLDLPDALDFQNSIHILREAEEAFASLPATVREKFRNDPGEFLAAFQDPSRADELRAMGFLKPAPAPQGTTSSTAPPDGLP